MFKVNSPHEVIVIANGVEIGVLRTEYTCDELKEIVDRQNPVDLHIFEEVH